MWVSTLHATVRTRESENKGAAGRVTGCKHKECGCGNKGLHLWPASAPPPRVHESVFTVTVQSAHLELASLAQSVHDALHVCGGQVLIVVVGESLNTVGVVCGCGGSGCNKDQWV